MIKDALGYKFHWAVADYLQRAARHIASKTDVEQAYALGKAAVETGPGRPQLGDAHRGAQVSRTSRTSGRSAWPPLKDVANVEKFMPRDFITEDGYGITDKCRNYLTR
jgi:ATP-dependent phosphofructokinase / diphosphate-dependent phosphofructokinase